MSESLPYMIDEGTKAALLRQVESTLITVAGRRHRGEFVSDQAEALEVVNAVEKVLGEQRMIY